MQATLLRPGVIIKHGQDLFSVHRAEHRTPGNKRGFIQARMRNLRTSAMIDYKFRSEDEVERVVLDEVEMQYLYSDDTALYFMNTQNYEQVHLAKADVGERAQYLVPNTVINVEFFEGRPVDIQLPPTVDLEVIETEPSLKGASVTNVMKAAKLETGLVVQVPPFISAGEKIRVDTLEGKYLERAR